MEDTEMDSLEQFPLNNNRHVASHGSTQDKEEIRNVADARSDEVPLASEVQSLLSVEQAQRWRQSTIGISIITVIVLLVLGITSFVVSAKTESAAAFGFGFDCVLDVSTSIVVIWRFYGSVSTLYSEHRERMVEMICAKLIQILPMQFFPLNSSNSYTNLSLFLTPYSIPLSPPLLRQLIFRFGSALLFIAGFFLIASFSITVRDITEVLDKTNTKNKSELIVLAAVSGAVCTILAIIKFIIAKKLQSTTVKSDGYSSLACAVTGFSILVSAKVINVHPNMWYLDNIVGFCVAALLLVYGIILLVGVLSNHCTHCIFHNSCCKDGTESTSILTEK